MPETPGLKLPKPASLLAVPHPNMGKAWDFMVYHSTWPDRRVAGPRTETDE
jgi:hypothetical protein